MTGYVSRWIINTYGGAPPRPSARRSVLEATAAIVSICLIVAALVYALSWTGEAEFGAPTAIGTTTSATTEPDTEEPSDDPPEDVGTTLQVGDTHVGENADITLLQTRQLRPPAEREARPGQEWFGVRAQICMQAESVNPSGQLRWSSWIVTDVTGTVFKGRKVTFDDYPEEQLPTSPIQPGACVRGWVLVEVTKDAWDRIETVGFAPSGRASVEWQV